MFSRRVNNNIMLLYLKNGEIIGMTPKDMKGMKRFLMEKAGIVENTNNEWYSKRYNYDDTYFFVDGTVVKR
ncbi:MAG TPA: hypothetical protein PKV93_10800 [Fervidobacterium sp.]|nr:hypothetical protein [Fervidobacterium sp.]